MDLNRREAEQAARREREERMQRETYERAGIDAYILGVPRAKNPFLREADAFTKPEEVERLRRLANHWWKGWDHAAARLAGPGRRVSRRRMSEAARASVQPVSAVRDTDGVTQASPLDAAADED